MVYIKFPTIDTLSADEYYKISVGFSGGVTANIKAIIVGHTFDFEHNPTMSSSVNIEFDGIKNNRSIGGHDSSVALNVGKPSNPFLSDPTGNFISNPNNTLGVEGRKSWEMNFNYLAQEGVLPNKFNDPTLITSNNLFSNVISKTIGNHLKFLFIPNTVDTNSRDMFLCKFDQSDFEFTEVASDVYDVSLKIVESW